MPRAHSQPSELTSLRASAPLAACVCWVRLTRSNSIGLPLGFFFGCVRSSPLADMAKRDGALDGMREEEGSGKRLVREPTIVLACYLTRHSLNQLDIHNRSA